MLEIYFKNAADKFTVTTEFKPGSWIYAPDATLEDLQKISEVTKIDLLDFRDSLDKYELPRIEYFDNNIVLFVRHPGTSDYDLYTETLTIILTPDFFIAISPRKCDIIESLILSNSSFDLTQKAKLILQILLKITQSYTNSVKRVRYSIFTSEQPLKTVDSNAILVLTKNEEILNQYLTSLVPMRNLLETMASGRHMNFYEQDLDLLEDLMIAVHQSEDLCRVNIQSIRSMRDSYQILFTNDVNRTIKLLTAVTIIVTFPVIIASIYGMNVPLPFQNEPYAFPVLMGVAVVVSLIAVSLFRKNRWL